MQRGWLLRDGQVLAAADLADTFYDRTRGLVARRDFDGAMFLPRTRSIHSFGVPFALDVAYLNRDNRVIALVRLARRRVSMPRLGAVHALEARAGSFDRWGLREGDCVEFRPTP